MIVRRLLDIFRLAERALTLIAGCALVLMMLVVVADVIGRSLNLWHILSTVEQIRLYMMLLGFLGLALCFRNQANIVVDVATHHLREIVTRRIDAFWAFCTAVILLPLGYSVFRDGVSLHDYGQRSEVLGISPLVYHAIAGFGFAVAAILSIVTAIQLLAKSDEAADEAEGNWE